MKEKKTELVGAKITKSQKEALQAIADREERTLSFLTAKAIEEYIERHQ